MFNQHNWSCVAEGVCEIWLTSEDTGAYGRDIGTDLPSLLWELVKEIPEGAMLRLGMTNPPYILEHLEVCPVPQQTQGVNGELRFMFQYRKWEKQNKTFFCFALFLFLLNSGLLKIFFSFFFYKT